MIIYVDADACPTKSIIAEEASVFRLRAIFVCSFANHFLLRDEWTETVVVDKSYQSVDMFITNRVKPGDLVITDDYGLACMVLGRKCLAISSRGKEYTNDNIDYLLSTRHRQQKERSAGKRSKGPKPFTPLEKEAFRQTLKKCLQLKEGDC
ncbi:YaiI/YqxD family protein [Ammoniphilus sp. CFH 90114]|uniref:YaiI/YqxD family protein n=1 Tax=Ammoniphilus sp. CFH 90114 TaxID=2493665 RepID=UPI0010100242|nr:YaiI/YqxD family protein [Ammoniphilus sp. CFH 90114]RXT14848.1 YaiI/YqxD family protein [Ammoniphilus sp. CFH 90114]